MVRVRRILRRTPRATVIIKKENALLQKMQRDKSRFFKFTRGGSFDE